MQTEGGRGSSKTWEICRRDSWLSPFSEVNLILLFPMERCTKNEPVARAWTLKYFEMFSQSVPVFWWYSTSTILLTISVAHFSAWWGSNNCVATFFNFLYCGLISSETVHWLTKCKMIKVVCLGAFLFWWQKRRSYKSSLFFLLPLAVLVQLFYSENTQISWKLPFSGGALYRSNQLICWVKTDSCLLKSTFVIFVYF